MQIDRLFSSFKRKLLWEGLLRSFLIGGSFGAAAAFAVSLWHHILVKETPMALTLAIAGGMFGVAFLVCFFVWCYPTKKRVARRVDALGLKERAGTMLEFRASVDGMARLQREDAVLHIQKQSAKNVKLNIRKREITSCLAGVLLAFVMIALPHDIFVFAGERQTLDPEREQLIDKLIAELREEVQNTKLDEEIKDDIDKIIDKLEEELKDTDSKLEQAGKVEDAKDEMSDRLEQELTKNSIGEQLKKYNLTRDLGQALCQTDKAKVTSSLEVLEGKIVGDHRVSLDLADLVERALRDSEVPASDELYVAFDVFAKDLKSMNLSSSTFEKDLATIFDRVEQAILAVLEKQAVIEEEKEKLEDVMDQIKQEILEEEKKEPSEDAEESKGNGDEGSGDGEGDKPGDNEGDKPGDGEGDKPGDSTPTDDPNGEGSGNPNGSVGGNGKPQEDTRVEGFYDPVSGNIGYGKVFDTYYAEYLKALKAGDVPEELQKLMDAYFAQLK